MSEPRYPSPTNHVQCGEFEEPETRDPGRSYAAALRPTCSAPSVPVDGGAEIVFVDGEPEVEEL